MEHQMPPVQPHGALREVLPDLFMVTGSVKMMGMVFSRNMAVIREGDRLVLVNTVRLDDAGLAALDKLGKVTDVIRIAGNHGMDDRFYREHYKAKLHCVKSQRYKVDKVEYMTADAELDADSPLPVAGAKLHVIDARPAEGILVLERHGGTLIAGDCLQNWKGKDEYFSFLATPVMKVMGFLKPHNIGPAWLKQCKPPKPHLAAINEMSYANVIPAHGDAVVGNARELWRPVIDRASR